MIDRQTRRRRLNRQAEHPPMLWFGADLGGLYHITGKLLEFIRFQSMRAFIFWMFVLCFLFSDYLRSDGGNQSRFYRFVSKIGPDSLNQTLFFAHFCPGGFFEADSRES